jgi:hypothetical protein
VLVGTLMSPLLGFADFTVGLSAVPGSTLVGAAVTVNVSAGDVCPPKAAVMSVAPTATPVARPVVDTIVAIVGADEVQATPEAAVTSGVVPSL